MRILPGLGAFMWLAGLLILAALAIGDAATPNIEHLDVLALGMAISGAILTLGSRD